MVKIKAVSSTTN